MRFDYVIIFVFMLLTAVSFKAKANEDQLWITFTARSWHTNREVNYNENNRGLGLEWSLNPKWSIAISTYINSYNQNSLLVGAQWKPIDLGDRFKLGLAMAGVTGYEDWSGMRVTPVILPLLTYERQWWGLNLVASHKFAGLQLKAAAW